MTDARVPFLVELARALHEAGAPAHRLEDTVALTSAALGVRMDVLSQPTSLLLGHDESTRVLRVEPKSLHLERLVAIDQVGTAVARGALSPEGALLRLREIAATKPRYGPTAMLVATTVTSTTSAVFLHADAVGVAVATVLGFCVAVLARLAAGNAGYGRLLELVGAFVVAAGVTLASRVWPVSVVSLTLAGVIALLPGLSLTVALTELATGHLASGTARFSGAAVTFLKLGLGSALGWRLAVLLPHAVRGTVAESPAWVAWAVLPLAALAFTVIFNARPRDLPFIVGAAALAYAAEAPCAAWFGPELGASVGGFVVGLASNLQARVRRVPTAVVQVPGLLMLVPGSIGFKGFGAMLREDISSGVGAGFQALVIAGALAVGILVAGVILPPRKSL